MDEIEHKSHKLVKALATLSGSIAKLLWPLIVIFILFHLLSPISKFVNITLNNAQGNGKILIKVGEVEVELSSMIKQDSDISTQLLMELKLVNDRVKKLETMNNFNSVSHIPSTAVKEDFKQHSEFLLSTNSSIPEWNFSKNAPDYTPNILILNNVKPLTSNTIKSILWVEDTPEKSIVVINILRGTGINVTITLTTEDALDELSNNSYSLVITDGSRNEPLVGGKKNKKAGLDLINKITETELKTPVLMFTSHMGLKKEAFNLGAIAVTSSQNELLLMIVSNECREACKN
jgi:CheY-like chemotaxis protein